MQVLPWGWLSNMGWLLPYYMPLYCGELEKLCLNLAHRLDTYTMCAPLYCGAFAEIPNKTQWHTYCHLQFCKDHTRHDLLTWWHHYTVLHSLHLTDPFIVLATQRYETLLYCNLLTNVDTWHYTVVSATWDTTVLWCIDNAVLTRQQITVLWWIDCQVLTQQHTLLYCSIQWLQPIGLSNTIHPYTVMCSFTHYWQGAHDVLIKFIDSATHNTPTLMWSAAWLDLVTQDLLSLYCDVTWENDYE